MCTKEQSGPTGAPAISLIPSQGRFTRGRVLVCRQASAAALNIKARTCVLIISATSLQLQDSTTLLSV